MCIVGDCFAAALSALERVPPMSLEYDDSPVTPPSEVHVFSEEIEVWRYNSTIWEIYFDLLFFTVDGEFLSLPENAEAPVPVGIPIWGN